MTRAIPIRHWPTKANGSSRYAVTAACTWAGYWAGNWACTQETGYVSPGTKTGQRTGTCSSRMTETDSWYGTIPRCARYRTASSPGMILDAAKVREMRRFHGGERAGECGRQAMLRIILDNPIPKGVRATGYEISPISERKSRGISEGRKRSDLRVSLFSCAHRQNHNGFRLIRLL